MADEQKVELAFDKKTVQVISRTFKFVISLMQACIDDKEAPKEKQAYAVEIRDECAEAMQEFVGSMIHALVKTGGVDALKEAAASLKEAGIDVQIVSINVGKPPETKPPGERAH